MATRLFKYLINDYYEEFCTNVTNWVSKDLTLVEHEEADRTLLVADRTLLGRGQEADRTLLGRGQEADRTLLGRGQEADRTLLGRGQEADRILLGRGQEADRTLLGRGQDIHDLRELYTEHVVPDTMVELWNIGAGHLSHKLAPGVEASASRSTLVNRFTTFIVKYLLTPDEHPTLTRFFTFRKVIDAMLTMDIIGLPRNLLKLGKIKPQQENQKRLKLVVRFFDRPEGKQALRRASLVLQLTGGLEAMTASNDKEGAPPKIVAMVKGEARKLIVYRLQRLFGVLHKDPLLEVGPAVANILGTAADLLLRFNHFLRYPFILCRLCRAWFPMTFMSAIVNFLREEEDILDVGVSVQLRDIAWQGRNESQALNWMTSAAVQEFLEQLSKKLLCHSLDVERKVAQVKLWESSKVTHIATASQNNICVRFAKEREEKSVAIDHALKALRKAKRMKPSNAGWKSHGIRFTRGNTFNSDDVVCEQRHPLGSGHMSGVKRVLSQDEVDSEKNRLEQCVLDAQLEVDRLLQCCMVPITRSQWSAWLDDNIVEFRKLMQTAITRRRQQNGCSAAFVCDFQYCLCFIEHLIVRAASNDTYLFIASPYVSAQRLPRTAKGSARFASGCAASPATTRCCRITIIVG